MLVKRWMIGVGVFCLSLFLTVGLIDRAMGQEKPIKLGVLFVMSGKMGK